MKILVVVIIIVLLYLFLICPGLRKRTDLQEMKSRLFAHRGLYDNQSDHPENSMKAFRLAIENDYGIEMDVQLTKDEIPVVFHDFKLERIARDQNGNPVLGKVSDYTYEELLEFHLLDSNERIPLFTDFLELVNGKVPLIIEYKIENNDTQLKVCEIVDQILRQYHGQYVVESFNPRGVLWYKKNRPEITRGQLSDCYRRWDPVNCNNPLFWALEYLMTNFMTRPDFIAYNHQYHTNLSRRLCKSLFRNFAVAYTIKSQRDLMNRKNDFDLFIFDSFVPENGADASKI